MLLTTVKYNLIQLNTRSFWTSADARHCMTLAAFNYVEYIITYNIVIESTVEFTGYLLLYTTFLTEFLVPVVCVSI